MSVSTDRHDLNTLSKPCPNSHICECLQTNTSLIPFIVSLFIALWCGFLFRSPIHSSKKRFWLRCDVATNTGWALVTYRHKYMLYSSSSLMTLQTALTMRNNTRGGWNLTELPHDESWRAVSWTSDMCKNRNSGWLPSEQCVCVCVCVCVCERELVCMSGNQWSEVELSPWMFMWEQWTYWMSVRWLKGATENKKATVYFF